MDSGPPKAAEAIAALLIPPACREEVLGDLHERYSSPRQYGLDALRTVPLVIVSRIRRTADGQALLIQAFALYMSFLGAAWFVDRALLFQQWALPRLAIPAGITLLGLILEDAYAKPGRRSPLSLARGPMLGLGLALVSQVAFWIGNPDLAVPRWIVFYGCGMSLLLSSTVRMLFPPAANQLQGANVPAVWLKQAGQPAGSSSDIIRAVQGAVAVIAAMIVGTRIAAQSEFRRRWGIVTVLVLLLCVLAAYRLWKRG